MWFIGISKVKLCPDTLCPIICLFILSFLIFYQSFKLYLSFRQPQSDFKNFFIDINLCRTEWLVLRFLF